MSARALFLDCNLYLPRDLSRTNYKSVATPLFQIRTLSHLYQDGGYSVPVLKSLLCSCSFSPQAVSPKHANKDAKVNVQLKFAD